MKKTNRNKGISIFAILIIVITLIILFFSVKAICFSNNENLELSSIQTENIADTETENSVLLIKLDEEQEKTEEENTAKQENVQQENIQTPVINKIKKYTYYKGKNYNNIGIINIPRLGINYPILGTTTEETLKASVTKFWGGNPNEVGNLCIIGHNYKNSKFFGKLPNIQNGDTIQITDMNGNTLNYSVYDNYTVIPEDTSCTSQLTNGKIEVTLITCYYENGNAHATKRLIVKARVN